MQSDRTNVIGEVIVYQRIVVVLLLFFLPHIIKTALQIQLCICIWTFFPQNIDTRLSDTYSSQMRRGKFELEI